MLDIAGVLAGNQAGPYLARAPACFVVILNRSATIRAMTHRTAIASNIDVMTPGFRNREPVYPAAGGI